MTVNLFDVSYYREANTDLAALSDVELSNHFFTSGLYEGRPFSRFVDLNFYRASNSDLTSLDTANLYSHLANSGVSEGRRFSPFFDVNFYRTVNTDLPGSGFTSNEQLFDHYQNFGINDGRLAISFVDLNFYRYANSDLSTLANAQLLSHLRQSGINEERRFSPVVNLGIYEAASPDLKAANVSYSDLLQHLEIYGIFESRRLSVSYDPATYVQNNIDLAASNGQQLIEHFVLNGSNEGRVASDSFNVNSYRNTNGDLAGLVTNQAFLYHFEGYGFREERVAGATTFAIPAGVEPGNDSTNLTTAANLGILSSRRSGTISQQINSSDLSGSFLSDIYRILIPTTSNVDIRLSGNTQTLNLQVSFDSNGDNRNQGGNTEEIFSRTDQPFTRTLGPGTYYVTIFTATQTTNTNYNLTFSATTVPTVPAFPDPGETATAALNLGTLNSNTLQVQNFIGVADKIDIYRFNIAAQSTLSLAVDNLSSLGPDRATLELYYDSNNNNQLDSSELVRQQQNINPSFSFTQLLASGTYFLRFSQTFAPAGNTSFRLNLSAA